MDPAELVLPRADLNAPDKVEQGAPDLVGLELVRLIPVDHLADALNGPGRAGAEELLAFLNHFLDGERPLFDLETDPGELSNVWDDPSAAELKTELTRRLLFAEMEKEITPMPRIAGA